MVERINRRVVLARRPTGELAHDLFDIEDVPLRQLDAGEVHVKVAYIGVDAFIRTTFDEGAYHGTAALRAPVTALGVGEVVASRFDGLSAGDWVTGPVMAQTDAVMPGNMFTAIDVNAAPASAYLGVLGLTTGLTAYFGMRDVAEVRDGDVVVVSAAAGAVGSCAVQIARALGAGKVIGIAGGPDKMRYLSQTLGVDGAIDYRNDDVAARLDALAPDGIDAFFDNVGGENLDRVLDRLRTGARIAICGAISQYGDMEHVRGPRLYLRLAERNSRMAGFTVTHYAEQFGEAMTQLGQWMAAGTLHLPEQVEHGIDAFPEALLKLFNGGHVGKLLVKA